MPDSPAAEPPAATVKPPVAPPLTKTVDPEAQYALLTPENVKPVGADGAVPSICSVLDCTEEAWSRLSIANHLIVCAVESWKVALGPLTVVAVPLAVGSVPSVV